MGKLKNQAGSTMLVTVSLIALFSILLVGFHTAIQAMTNRLDGNYHEKQTYLYSRSAVTALAQELMDLNAAYDEKWQEYYDAVESGDVPEDELPERPVKDGLLKAVDHLTQQSPTLVLSDCTFGDTLEDGYDLQMTIHRVVEQDEDGKAMEAYKLSATTTMDGVNKVSDTVSILLSTSGKEFVIGQESSGSGSGSGGEDEDTHKDGTASIYTDKALIFTWNKDTNMLLNGIKGGSTIVGGGDMVYDLYRPIDNGDENIQWMIDGDLTLNNISGVSVKNVDFYIKGDLTLNTHTHERITIKDCNFYVQGDMLINGGEWQYITLENCNMYAQTYTDSDKHDRYIEINTNIFPGANVDAEMAKIPTTRPLPAWVGDAENNLANGTFISYSEADAKANVPMTAGNVYKLSTDMDLWDGNIRDGVVGTATKEAPITIVVGPGVDVGLQDSCGPYTRFLVEPGGRLTVATDAFEGDIYGYPPDPDLTDAYVFLKGTKKFFGTFVVPTLEIEGDNMDLDYGGTTSKPETTTETVSYNIYTNYIYVRG